MALKPTAAALGAGCDAPGADGCALPGTAVAPKPVTTGGSEKPLQRLLPPLEVTQPDTNEKLPPMRGTSRSQSPNWPRTKYERPGMCERTSETGNALLPGRLVSVCSKASEPL